MGLDNQKQCSKCDIFKSFDQFKKGHNQCKECKRTYDRNYREINKEKIKTNQHIWYEDNKEEILLDRKQYHKDNKEIIKIKKKEYREDNKEKIKEYSKQYCEDNKEIILLKNKQYNENHKEEIKEYQSQYTLDHKEEKYEYDKQYRIENKTIINKNKNEFNKKKRREDPIFKLKTTVSSGINRALKSRGFSKQGKSILSFLPYTIKKLVLHIENLFEPWMNWGNHGVYDIKTWDDNCSSTWTWQLDHIVPHSTFKYETMNCQEFRECWALSNLRPLSAKQNNIDGNRRINIK